MFRKGFEKVAFMGLVGGLLKKSLTNPSTLRRLGATAAGSAAAGAVGGALQKDENGHRFNLGNIGRGAVTGGLVGGVGYLGSRVARGYGKATGMKANNSTTAAQAKPIVTPAPPQRSQLPAPAKPIVTPAPPQRPQLPAPANKPIITPPPPQRLQLAAPAAKGLGAVRQELPQPFTNTVF